ncbi:DNA-binding protein [candidate division KSB1 bacterium]
MEKIKKLYYNDQQVSEITGWSLSKLRHDRMSKKGIPYSKVGHTVRYNIEDIKEYFESCKIKTQVF